MNRQKKVLLLVSIFILVLILAACGSGTKGTKGQEIIEAKEVAGMLGKSGIVLVDMQNPEDYQSSHVKGAVNITRSDIVINVPVENMLASQGKIANLLGQSGISNDTLVVIYDNTGNMDAARLWWTMKIYGHEKVKVVSGGWNALKSIGMAVTSESSVITPATYQAKGLNQEMIATTAEVKAFVNDPGKKAVILDTRTKEEYEEGRIPGSVLLDYKDNNFTDGTYKPIQHIQIQYLEAGVKPDKPVIMYCKTSIRAAQTYLALYNAGYRNLKLYDGAWLEWTSDISNPVEMPAGGSKIEPSQKDMS